jgi:hypothetical protein
MWYRLVDIWIERLKWPTAALAIAWLPFIVWACLRLSIQVLSAPLGTIAFGAGLALFIAGWKLYLRFQSIGLWLMRAEHEATHLLFAMVTFHPVVGLSRESRNGSHVRFLGSGNWLIQISPYFFPTAAVVLWVFAALIPFSSFFFLKSIVLGFATGFHVVSTIREIKRDQDELRSLSWKFCWLFLPAANLVLLGAMLAYSQDGWSGFYRFFSDTLYPLNLGWKLLFPTPNLPVDAQ